MGRPEGSGKHGPKKPVPRTGRPVKRTRLFAGILDPGHTSDELEFMRAVEKWKHDQHRPFPLWSDVLAVLLSLGYRKVVTMPTHLPPELEEAARGLTVGEARDWMHYLVDRLHGHEATPPAGLGAGLPLTLPLILELLQFLVGLIAQRRQS